MSAYRDQSLDNSERLMLFVVGTLGWIAAVTIGVLFWWPLLVYVWHYWMG